MKFLVCIIFLLIGGIFASTEDWHLSIWLDGGILYELILGVSPDATDGFDAKLDKPAPPVPPAGFFPYFPCDDKKYSYLPALWGDVRHPADSIKWQIILRNTTVPVSVEWENDSLPAGYIAIEGTDMRKLGGHFDVADNDTVVVIQYSKRAPVEQSFSPTSIMFTLKSASTVVITISDRNGNIVDTIGPKKFSAGSHSINWNYPAQKGIYLYRVEADGEKIAQGKIVLIGAK